jgi:hypothetical protein
MEGRQRADWQCNWLVTDGCAQPVDNFVKNFFGLVGFANLSCFEIPFVLMYFGEIFNKINDL